MQTAPGRFECLKLRVMHDRVELPGQQIIDFCDALVDHRHNPFVRTELHVLVEDLGCKLSDQLFRIGFLRRLIDHLAVLDDLIEQAACA